MKTNYQTIFRQMFRDACNAAGGNVTGRHDRQKRESMTREEIIEVCKGAVESERTEIDQGLRYVAEVPLTEITDALRGLHTGRDLTSREQLILATFAWIGFHAAVQAYAKQNNITAG